MGTCSAEVGMMKYLLLVIAIAVASAEELKVDSYFKPEGCAEAKKVKKGDHIKMHYTGTIDKSSSAGEKGTKFDSSRDHDEAFATQIGVGQVIKGWDEGVPGMCVGEKRNLIIPAELGYGASGAGDDIPGGATLHFDVELVEISDGPPPEKNLFAELDVDKDKFLTEKGMAVFFTKQGQEMPKELMGNEDTDKDGKISWDEFSGPKGASKDDL